jgi:hypothetical protein
MNRQLMDKFETSLSKAVSNLDQRFVSTVYLEQKLNSLEMSSKEKQLESKINQLSVQLENGKLDANFEVKVSLKLLRCQATLNL